MERVLKKNFDSLQLLRGIAAGAVVFFHGFEEAGMFAYGKYGVDLFFVLSGFIIMYIHYNDIGDRKALFPFVMKRFFRIFPVYWVVTLAYIALVSIAGYTFASGYILQSALLIPQDKMPVVGVAWTLEFEVLFYMLFALLMIHRKAFIPLLFLWFAAILAYAVYPVELPRIVARIFHPLNLEFLYGCIIALLFLRTKEKYAMFISSLGLLSIIVSASLQSMWPYELHRSLAWGVPFAFLILGLIKWESKHRLRIPKIFVLLGDASYSIYLTHLITLLVLETALEKAGLLALPNAGLQLLFCIIAIAAGFVFYILVEKPFLRLVRSRLLQSRRKPALTTHNPAAISTTK